MKSVEWGEWVARRRAMAGAVAIAAEQSVASGSGPLRARTVEQREMIVRGAVALMRKREREGRLVQVGKRRYELRSGE